METLRASRFLLRRFTSNDAPSLTDAVIESASTVGRFMPWAHPAYSTKDALDWIRYCEGEWAKGASFEFGIFDAASLQLVGGCGLNQFNSTCRYCILVTGYVNPGGARARGLQRLKRLRTTDFRRCTLVGLKSWWFRTILRVWLWLPRRAPSANVWREIGSPSLAPLSMPLFSRLLHQATDTSDRC